MSAPFVEMSLSSRLLTGIRSLPSRSANGAGTRLSTEIRYYHSQPKCVQAPANLQEQENAQKIKFSPHRARDTSACQISAKLGIAGSGQVFGRGMSGTTNSSDAFNALSSPKDSHVPVYDQNNSVSLSSVMQTNVPDPFQSKGNVDRSGHLCMPGGHWAQNDKYVSSDLHEHQKQMECSLKKDFTSRHLARASIFLTRGVQSNALWRYPPPTLPFSHLSFCTHTLTRRFSSSDGVPKLSSRQKLQRAVKEYGTTVIVFHVTISLASLGLCYLLVSSGIDMSALLDKLGIDFSKISSSDSASDPPSSDSASDPPSSDSASDPPSSDSVLDPPSSAAAPKDGSPSSAGAVAAGVSTFVVAYAVHKVFAPARIATTLTATPFIVRSLRARGILKPANAK